MGEVAEVVLVNILAEEQKKKEEKNKAREAKKKAAEEDKRRQKVEEEKQKRERCLQQANELRRQLQGHPVTPNISHHKPNVQSQAPNALAKANVAPVHVASANLVPTGAYKKSGINGHSQSHTPRTPVRANVTPAPAALAKTAPISTIDASKRSNISGPLQSQSSNTLVKANVDIVPVASVNVPAGASKKPDIHGHPQSQTPRAPIKFDATPATLPKATPVSTTDVSKRSDVSGHSQSQVAVTPANVKRAVTLAPVTLARIMPTSTTDAAQNAPVKVALTPVRVAPKKSVPVSKIDAPNTSEISHHQRQPAPVTFVSSVTTSTTEISFVVGQILVKAKIDLKINSEGFVLKKETDGAKVQGKEMSNASTSQKAAEDQKNQDNNNNAAALPNKTNTAPATTTTTTTTTTTNVPKESSNNSVTLTNQSENAKESVVVPQTKNTNCVSSELRKQPYVDHRPLNHSSSARNYYDVYHQMELKYQAAQKYYPWRIDDGSDQKYHGSGRRVTNGSEQRYNGNGRRFTKGGGQESQKDKKMGAKR
uniref:mucin-5AC-like n=1 Tax=Fragaria vesca subsp. vesca TaxID=101020 RepID=UPI0005CAD33A|nr:PREDICTED: mucin-5AC-like [Fragaria vesca subsp. vesca]